MLNLKRLLSLTLALLMVCSLLPAAAFAQDTCAHEWEWDEDDGPFYQICALCDEEWELEKITGPYEGSPVYWTLTPDGTMTVSGEGEFGEDYFYGDDLPDGQLAWEPYAPYITTLTVEEGITYFYGTPDLTGLTAAQLPASLEEFSASKVLRGSPNLTTVTVDKDNPRYGTVDNVVFDWENNTLLYYPRGKTDTSYTVPGCSIGSNAFYNNKYLESLVVEEGSVYLASNAISNCKNLTELTLPVSLRDVLRGGISDSVETIRYAGNETQWKRIYIHPDNDLSAVDVVFGVPKSDIAAQWNMLHTVLSLKGDAAGASHVVVSFYQPNGRMVKSAAYTAAQVAAGVDVTVDDADLSNCSAKIMVLDGDFAPIYDCTVPDGDLDYAALATFEGWLYEMDEMELVGTADDKDTRPGELLFSDDEQTLIVDAAGVSTPGCMGLGQKYIVTYNWQTGDLISTESAGVSVTGSARLDEVECTTATVGNSRKYLFTFGQLEEMPFDGDVIARMDMDAGFWWLSPTEMRDLTFYPRADEYTAIDREGDGDIDYLLVRPVQYGRVVQTGTDKKKGDYMSLQLAGEPSNSTTRYYLEELNGPDELPDDLEEGDIIKLIYSFERSDTSWEVLPAESMTLEKVIWKNNEYTFDGRTFTQAENGWDLSDVLVTGKLGDPFTVAYDGDLLVWAEAEAVSLDAAEIYADGDTIDPDARDAVELMYALGLMKGDEKGNFNPEGTFNRAEMARLIYVILNYGKDDDAVNYKGASIFSDVEPGAWYEGYVNYCAMTKLIQGTDGAFGPNEPVTCAKAPKMLLTAIGYSAEKRGYVGENWEKNVLSDAAIIGLLDGYNHSTNGIAPRQWVAKLVENCLLQCYTYDTIMPPSSGLIPDDADDDDLILMGEKYFKLTEDSDIYRSVYTEETAPAAPDITVKAGLEKLVHIDPEVFQEFLEDEMGSSKYEVSHVTISGAPASDAKGYLVTDGEELTGTKASFYMDPTARQYDLEDLYYQAGDKTGDTDAEFTLYYTSGTSTKTASIEGVIRFKTTAAASSGNILSGTVNASRTMDFASELTAFEKLGGNDNTYITIDSLPTHGRLVYNWGTADQQDVSIGKEYYLGGEPGKLQLSKVTYVPAYSADKTAKTDTFAVTGFSAKSHEVEGTVSIHIEHAARSAYFTDVTHSYYADSVDFVYNQKISTGMTASTFGLDYNVTRGQFVTFLYRAAGSPVVTGVTNNFTDVSTSDYYYNAVMWAVKNGIVSGTTATTFDPASIPTRQQALTFLYRFAVHYQGRDGSLGSPDGITDYADVEAWAQVPVKWAAGHGFVGDGTLEPNAVLDRGTTAVYLHGALTGLAGSVTPEPDPEPVPATQTVLAYDMINKTAADYVSLDVIAPDGTKDTLIVTEMDGKPAVDAEIALPAFYEVTENADGEASLTLITGDFAKQGIYAGQVHKYTYRTDSVILDDADKTELTAADTFTLYDGNFDVESDELADVEKTTPYIFFAPDEEAVYAIDASNGALNDLFVRLGGNHDTAAKYGDSYFIDPDARDAVSFLYDLGVMKSDDKGNFNPDGTFIRAELAKMIYVILNYGEDDKGEDYVGMNFFTDVDGAWYEGYANYCAANGLMGGKADGTFAPYETVTCPQVATLLLTVMGYDAEARGYVGVNWASAVLSDAAILGLLDGYKANTQTTVSRQWLAVMVANALRNCYTTHSGSVLTKLVTHSGTNPDPNTYILMGDKYYDLGLEPALELTLLVDGYCADSRNGKIYAVDAVVDGELGDYDVDPDSDIAVFIDDSNMESSNSWGLLIPYAGDENATTNVAEYTLDDDDVMHLYQTRKTFIDLNEEDLESSETAYYGEYDGQQTRVQANKGTVFCYVDADRNVETVTGYKNSYDVVDSVCGIRAMYAVATEIEENYFVADIIVIETEKMVPVSVVLGYDVTNRTIVDYVSLDALDADAELEALTVVELDGENAKDAEFSVPAFYEVTENADGEATLTTLTENFAAYGIYAVTLERVNALYEYITTTDGDEFDCPDGTPVYHLEDAGSSIELTAEDENGEALTLQEGASYILYTENGEVIYALLVESGEDVSAPLFTAISGKTLEKPLDPDQQTADQIAASLPPLTLEVEEPTFAAVKDAAHQALYVHNGNAVYEVVLPDFTLDGTAGAKTLENVPVTVQVNDAFAQTTVSITVYY